MHITGSHRTGLGFFVGLVATVVALFALVSTTTSARDNRGRYDGWDDSLGV